MLTPIRALPLAIILTAAACPAQTQPWQPLNFSGTQTPIYSSGEVIGYSFSNVYGNGTDAVMDVVWSSRTGGSSGYFRPGEVRESPPETITFDGFESYGDILIYNAASQYPGAATGADSLAIKLRPGSDVADFEPATVDAKFDFFVHDSQGNPLTLDKPFRFITRDVDGSPSPPTGITESITFSNAQNLEVQDPAFLNLADQTITGSKTDIDPTSGDLRGTASWLIDSPSFSMNFVLSYDEHYIGHDDNLLFVFDGGTQPVPEPASILSITGTGAVLLIHRRRRNQRQK